MLRDDKKFNVNFVREIQRHPCLYNHNDPNYSSREVQDRTWTYIGGKMGGTADECRSRWKNLRGSFTRYLKMKTRDVHRNVKPYYMQEFLQFILPFTKQRPQYDHSSYSDNEDDFLNPETEVCLTIDDSDPPIGVKRSADPIDHFTPSKRFVTTSSSNSDMDFFKSLLPDLCQFNSKQKRKFKLQVLQLIDEISTDRDGNSTIGIPSTDEDDDNSIIQYQIEVQEL